MFYNFKNLRVLVNGSGILATDMKLDVQANIAPAYLATQRHSKIYRADDGIGGNLSLNYYLTGSDPLKNYLTNEKTPISGNLGGLSFNSGYLKSYNLNCGPNQPVSVSANIVFFDELKGIFNPSYDNIITNNILNFADVFITDPSNGNIGSISNVQNAGLTFNSDIQPQYLAGQTVPKRVVFGIKTIEGNIVTDNLSGDLPVSGKNAGISINFRHPNIPSLTESFTVSGSLYQRNIATSVNNFVTSSLSIKQNYIDAAPIVVGFSPALPALGDLIAISGTNLSNITSLFINDRQATFYIINDSLISGIIPNDAISGPIIVNGFGGTTTGGNITLNYGNITVSGFTNITGAISGFITISGSNFNRITDVIFNTGVTSSFSVLSSNIIQATVPEYSAWGPIWVSSAVRGISGLSPYYFVPTPRIDSFTPLSGLSGASVVLQGRGFSGITGVLFNNLPNISPFTASFTVNSNTGITVTVPSGNVRGLIKVMGQSGVFDLSNDEFGAVVVITNVNPSKSKAGVAVDISGINFQSDLLYNVNGKYLVTFGNGVASGYFDRVNSSRLTGLVPYGAQSGAVLVYDLNLNAYSTSGYWSLQHNLPVISTSGVQTGFYSGFAGLQGSDFFETSSILLTGFGRGTGNIIPSVGQLGDSLSFQYPDISGGYYNIVVTTPQGVATGISGLFIRDSPIYQAIIPSSGAVGALTTFSGRGIYSDSQVFFNSTGFPAQTVGNDLTFQTIQFYVPSTARTGLNDVILYNQRGWATGSGSFRLIAGSSFSGVNPSSGTFGDSASLSGLNLGNITGLYLGSIPITTFTNIGNTGITFTVPNNSTTNYIAGISSAGTIFTTGKFAILSPNVFFSGFTPQSGYWGDTLIFSGTRLDTVTKVGFTGIGGEINPSFTTVGISGITIQVPLGALSGTLKIYNDRFTSNSPYPFLLINSPAISGFSPPSGKLGDIISISGSSLSGCSFLFPNINGSFVQAGSVSYINNTGVNITVPREIINGPIIISDNNRYFGFSVNNFIVLPTISGFTPTGILTGQQVTITGINAGSYLTGAIFMSGADILQNILSGLVSINYNNISGSNITNFSTGYTLINFTVNNNFIGTGGLFLINSYWTGVTGANSLRSSDFTATQNVITGNLNISQLAPNIFSFSPARGNSNTLVTLLGDSLLKTTGIYLISGSTVSQGTLITSGQNSITFNPPASFNPRSGQFQVYTLFGNSTSINYFTYLQSPLISGYFPVENTTGTPFVLSGLGIADVTGLYFNNYQTAFSIVNNGGITQLSGTVPFTNDDKPLKATISIYSEAGSYSFSSQFTIHPSGTQFWGELSGKYQIHATGYEIQNQTIPSGGIVIYSSNLSENGGNYINLSAFIGNKTVRFMTYRVS